MKTRRKLLGLDPADYEHPFDKAALEKLESIPGVKGFVIQIWEKFLDRLCIFETTGSNVEITKANYPDIYNLHFEACSILDIREVPPLYLENEPRVNASASGVNRPFVKISYGAIERLEKDELLFVLGHELGHIKSGHVLYYYLAQNFKPIIEVASQMSLGLAGLAGGGVQIALNYWSRMSEFTADRAGLLVCQDTKPCIKAMMKLSGLPFEDLNINEFEKSFLKQANEFKDFDYGTLNKFIRFGSTVDRSHPWNVLRAAEFLKWEKTESYKNIVSGKKIEIAKEDLSFCPKCGAKVYLTDKFCGKYGAKNI